MLKVEKFKNKGRGVVSTKEIAKYSLVERCPVLLFKIKEGNNHLLEGYAFRWDKKTIALALGLGSLYNHSSKFNLVFDFNKKQKTIDFYAFRNIEKGEELVFDYGAYSLWFNEK